MKEFDSVFELALYIVLSNFLPILLVLLRFLFFHFILGRLLSAVCLFVFLVFLTFKNLNALQVFLTTDLDGKLDMPASLPAVAAEIRLSRACARKLDNHF